MEKNIGSSFDSWLREEGIQEQVATAAIRRVLARQRERAMKKDASQKDYGGRHRGEAARNYDTQFG